MNDAACAPSRGLERQHIVTLWQEGRMNAHARDPYVSPPVFPHASAPRHGKAGGPAGQEELSFTRPFPDSAAGEKEFDFGRPFLVDIGRAAVIAEWLRESGYPTCTADVVIAELARPGRERTTIGRFAAGLLETAGWRP
jgi:hypothetical protein